MSALLTGLAGLEPTTYGLGNRPKAKRGNDQGEGLPTHVPNRGQGPQVLELNGQINSKSR